MQESLFDPKLFSFICPKCEQNFLKLNVLNRYVRIFFASNVLLFEILEFSRLCFFFSCVSLTVQTVICENKSAGHTKTAFRLYPLITSRGFKIVSLALSFLCMQPKFSFCFNGSLFGGAGGRGHYFFLFLQSNQSNDCSFC